jgi:ubiquinone/menaquinone biosynthesis C-methylase UbiE
MLLIKSTDKPTKPYRFVKDVAEANPGRFAEIRSWSDPLFAKKLWFKNGQSILDVGCFKGVDIRALKVKYPASRCVGVDILPEAVDYCRKNNQLGIEFIQADGANLPFKDQEFDIALSNSVLCEMPERERGLMEHKRVAKKVYICDVDLDSNDGAFFYESF